MKKICAFIILLGIAWQTSGQTYLSEDFSSNQMPPAGWTIENLQNQWSISQSSNAGGTVPEGKFNWTSSTTVTRLITPEIDLTGLTTVTLMFNHFYDDYTGAGPKAGVATRSGSGAWTTVWEINPTSNVGPETIILSITNSDVGQADFQFCFYLDGNMYNIDYWYLDDILLYTPFDTDLALTSIDLPDYLLAGNSSDLAGKVKNLGINNVTSFDVSYYIDGTGPSTYSVTGVNLATGDSYDFTHDIPLLFNDPGTYEILVNIENINGGPDDDPSNDTLVTHVGVVPYAPDKKVFAEEATGTWCGWCIRGICYMDYMAATYPDTWIGVSVHDADPMENAIYNAEIPNIIPNFPGWPSGTIERVGDYWDPEDFETGYLERIDAISPGTVGIYNFSWDPGSRLVTFDVVSDILIDIYNELRFCAVIIEDSLWGTTSGWEQANYYSGGGNGPMCGFELEPDPIPAADMHYDYVARDILDSPYGTPGSIPVPAFAGTYTYTYTYPIPTDWIFEKLRFVGLLMDHTTGAILNANDEVFWVGVNKQNQEIRFSVSPNPFSSSANIHFTLAAPSDVAMNVYDLLGRPVYSESRKPYPAGENKIRLDGENLDNGFYVVELNIGNKSYTQKVTVAK